MYRSPFSQTKKKLSYIKIIYIVEQFHFCLMKCNIALLFRLSVLCKEEIHVCMQAPPSSP